MPVILRPGGEGKKVYQCELGGRLGERREAIPNRRSNPRSSKCVKQIAGIYPVLRTRPGVVRTFSPSTQKAKAGDLRVQDQPGCAVSSDGSEVTNAKRRNKVLVCSPAQPVRSNRALL